MNSLSKHSEKNLKYDKLIMTGKIFFFVFLACTFGFMLVYSILDKEGSVKHDEIKYIESWTVIDAQGNSFETGRYFQDNKRYDGDFTIVSKLPDKIGDEEVLCFIANIEVTVYIGGEVRQDIGIKDEFMLPAGHVKRFYAIVPLEKSDAGAEIKMVRSTPSSMPEVVPETFVTSLYGVYSVLFERYGVTFSLSVVMLAFSTVIIVLSICMRIWFRQKIDMLYGGLGILVVAAWLVTNSYLYPFIYGHYHVDGVANYMFCLMIPFGFVIYLDAVQHGRYKKYMALILIFSAINAVLWTVLNFTGILSYVDALLYIDVILGILEISAVVILIADIKNGNINRYKFTVIGILGFLFFSAIELLSLTFYIFKDEDFPMLVGLGFLLTFVIIQQVDDLRKINIDKQRALDLSDAKTKFLASMSHEIRTPINSILGMNEIILKENKDEAIDGYAKVVRSSGKMLLTLVNDVLDFSKIESGKLEIIEAEYSISRVFSEILPMLLEQAVNKSLELSVRIENPIPDGQISDEARLKQIIINLVSNAIKYTDKGSVEIILSGEESSGDSLHDFEMSISVKDTGRGIRKEDIGNLFDAFSRVDLKKNSSIEGTGLGLTIVKSILDSMGGRIEVSSEYGKGSVFTAIIPVKVYDETPAKENFLEREEVAKEDYKCDYTSDAAVLAVDDNSSNLTIIKLFLKETGMVPELCTNGKDAIELCSINRYDLIILDHMMPEPDGLETLKAIREDPDSMNRDTTAIVLTANAIAGSRQMYLEAGFTDYLTKPIDSRRLLQTVKKYLPKEKIHPKIEDSGLSDKKSDSNVDKADFSSFKEAMASYMPDFDYKNAIMHCAGDESMLKEIMSDISSDFEAKTEKMKRFKVEGRYDMYCIEVHALKGLMATIGIKTLSDRAKKHEMASKENDIRFIEDDFEAFIKEYEEVCRKIRRALGEE